jgi:hypothetical protein
MPSLLPLKFLQEKINQLQTALFFNTMTSVLKIPTHVIQVITVDDAGQIWFCLPAPHQLINEFDKKFCCELQFFRKGKNFYLKVVGTACIINDPEEINSITVIGAEAKDKVFCGESILVKVDIHAADYFKTAVKTMEETKRAPGMHPANPAFSFMPFMRRLLLPHHYPTAIEMNREVDKIF